MRLNGCATGMSRAVRRVVAKVVGLIYAMEVVQPLHRSHIHLTDT